jgi:hypothetical protein
VTGRVKCWLEVALFCAVAFLANKRKRISRKKNQNGFANPLNGLHKRCQQAIGHGCQAAYQAGLPDGLFSNLGKFWNAYIK